MGLEFAGIILLRVPPLSSSHCGKHMLRRLSSVGTSESVVLLALAGPWTAAQLSMVVQAGGWAAKP